MKSRRLSRTSRRGYTLAEVATASALTTVVLASVAAVLAIAGRMEHATILQSSLDRKASVGMNRMILDAREAREVEMPAVNRLRIFYPITRADGHYDRFQTDRDRYVEYAQTDASGTPQMAGEYLWRKTESTTGRAVLRTVKQLRISAASPKAVRITLHLEKTERGRTHAARLTERVLYLRNN